MPRHACITWHTLAVTCRSQLNRSCTCNLIVFFIVPRSPWAVWEETVGDGTMSIAKGAVPYNTVSDQNGCQSQWPSDLRRVYGRSLAVIVGSNPATGMDGCPLWVLCCQVEVSATGWSLVQRSPTDCGASLCVISEPPEGGGSNS